MTVSTLDCNDAAGAFVDKNGFQYNTSATYTGTGLLVSGGPYDPIYYMGASAFSDTGFKIKLGAITSTGFGGVSLLFRKGANGLKIFIPPTGNLVVSDEGGATLGTISNTHTSGDEYNVNISSAHQVSLAKNGAAIGGTYTTTITAANPLRIYFDSGSEIDNIVIQDSVFVLSAPGTPIDLVPSAQTSTTMTLTATPDGSGSAAASWDLEHSIDGTAWTAISPQASNAWNVTHSGVSGHDHWRVRAVNGIGASAWYSETIGFSNPTTGGGGGLDTYPVVLELSPTTLSMIAGESRQIVITAVSDSAPVVGRTCAVSVTSGPATLTTPSVMTPSTSVTTAPTNSDGQAAFIATATGVGRIVIDVT